MKKVLFLLALVILCSFAPAESEPIKLSFPIIMAILTGVWEVIGRVIPSVGQITVIGKVIEILSWISNFLNRKK
jgi:hypothetical protein